VSTVLGAGAGIAWNPQRMMKQVFEEAVRAGDGSQGGIGQVQSSCLRDHYEVDNLVDEPGTLDLTNSTLGSISSSDSFLKNLLHHPLRIPRNASTSSKDSGHCIDCNTTNSSKSTSSDSSEKCTNFHQNPSTPKTLHSSMYSIDKEFYYMDKKLEQITNDCEMMKTRSVHPFIPQSFPVNHNDPIYETIPEVSESDDAFYCQPFDLVKNKKPQLSEMKQRNLRSKSSETLKSASHEKFSNSPSHSSPKNIHQGGGKLAGEVL
jgi:hypothetical protein